MAKSKKALILYDGECPLCLRSVRKLRRLDWLGRLDYADARHPEQLPSDLPPLEPEALLREMHLVTADREGVHRGFGAFRWLAWRLPLLWPVVPLLYVPGVPTLGRKIYAWIARNRMGSVSCREGVCHVPKGVPFDN
jgi:predicted DCC family thiol-disulfide oxidoreductase YuxK